jgi:D-sedoheptulose 7-phosphate isomerase
MNKAEKTSGTEYLKILAELLAATGVTDGIGKSISFNDAVAKVIGMYQDVKRAGAKVMLVGNGGSAGIVSHVQNDICKRLDTKAIVFHETPLLTAIANDHGYENAFDRPLRMWADAQDVLIAVSSSGKSESILRPVRSAKERGCRIITFTGFQLDNPLRKIGDINFFTASTEYGYVEVAHMAINHLLTDIALWETMPSNKGVKC